MHINFPGFTLHNHIRTELVCNLLCIPNGTIEVCHIFFKLIALPLLCHCFFHFANLIPYTSALPSEKCFMINVCSLQGEGVHPVQFASPLSQSLVLL